MDYKQTVTGELRLYNERKMSIERLAEELEALEYEKKSLGGMSDSDPVQTSNTNRQEAKLINIISRQDTLRWQLAAVKIRVRKLEKALGALDAKGRRVIEVMYIIHQRGGVERLAAELVVGSTQIHRMKEKALTSLTVSLYGDTEMIHK